MATHEVEAVPVSGWASQERLAALVELGADAVVVLDAGGRIVWASPAARAVLGHDPEALAGRPFSDVIGGGDLPRWAARADGTGTATEPPPVARGTVRCRDREGLLRDVDILWHDLSCDPRVAGVVLQCRAADGPRTRPAFDPWDVIEQSLLAVFVVQDWRIVYANPKAVELAGYVAGELLGRDWLALVVDADRQFVRAELERVMRPPGQSVQFVARAERRDGAIVQAESYCAPTRYDDRPAVLVTVIDVSERVRLEEQLRQAQKLEAIGRLAGGIAHDFNNLLTAIQGNAELLQHKLQGDPSLAADADEIFHAADRAASLTRQLLAFSRRQDIQPVTLDLAGIVESVARMARRIIGPKVQLESFAGPPTWVVADRAQLEQVVLNLIVNARDALPDGGCIRVGTGSVQVDAPTMARLGLPQGDYAQLWVSDDGIGMDHATQERIFEPFFTTKEPGRGTGLGLSTVYGTVRQMGGAITVTSERQHGALFEILLPRAVGD